MPPSPYKIKKILELKQKALTLYREGLSTREVAKIIGKSHTWVANSLRSLKSELSTDTPLQ